MKTRTTLILPFLVTLCVITPAFAGQPRVKNVEFTPTPAPASETEMVNAYTRSSAVVTYSDGSKKAFPLTHHVLYRSGDPIGGVKAGEIVDKDGQPILQSLSDEQGNAGRGPFYSYGPDGTSLISLPPPSFPRKRESSKEKLYLVTQFEYHTESPNVKAGGGPLQMYAQLPMVMNLASLKQDAKTGQLKVAKLSNIDMNPIKGLWIPCAASLTPWNTHLAGEEYEPDASIFQNEPLEAMNLFLKTPGKKFNEGGANPYDYGHLVELIIKPDGSNRIVKRYAMGRISFELGHVLPDGKTVYMGDDGRDTMLLMFLADKPRDLSSGTLYAAKWEQQNAEDGGMAFLKWIRLGHASEAEIKALVKGGVKFSDIFEVADAAAYKADPAKFTGFKPIVTYPGSTGKRSIRGEPPATYLRPKPGMEKAAAFLETRRYAAYLGATTEFTKMEGVTHNSSDRRLYIAMSNIEDAMIEGRNGNRPQDHIRIQGDPRDLDCGAVYQSHLAGGQKDSEGKPIASDWVAVSMQPLLLGRKKPAEQTAYGKYDKCDTDRMANPDNIKYSEEMRTLFIGEDSVLHLNNFLWAYNVDSGSLTRILSAPAGAEHTGLQVVTNLNGHSYIMGNFQHPGASNDLRNYPDEVKIVLRAKVDQRGAVGYIGGLPEIRR